jgi:rRNA-processing protein FCF1
MNNQFKRAILDTCVLFDALMIEYIRLNRNTNLVKKWEQTIYKGNFIYKENYTKFLDNIKYIITTSHVIGELQGLVNSSKFGIENKLRTSFWESSISYLRYKNLDERFIELLVLCDNQNNFKNMYDIGYVDTGLIELARKEKLPIITNDYHTLILRANQFTISTFNPEYQLCSKNTLEIYL